MTQTWRNCRYLVWGLGNSQWNAFLAFPRYVHKKLAELGATPLAELGVRRRGLARVGAPVRGLEHPRLARPPRAVRGPADGRPPPRASPREKAATGALTGTDSNTAMQQSLVRRRRRPQPSPRPTSAPLDHAPHVVRITAAGHVDPAGRRSRPSGRTQSRVLLAPTILTNAVGMDTVEARVLACRELQAAESPKRTRHLEISLPPGVAYRAGDHLGVCPKNDEERVERLARHLGTALDGLFMVPKTMNVRAVPKGVVLQVRNVLTNLVDITGRPTVPLLDLLLEKATDPAERSRLAEIRDVLQTPDGPGSPLRAAIDAGGYDVLRLLDEFPSCSLNIFEFLQVAQPLRPRYYSTSSSPRIHGDGVAHLTVGLEATPVPGMPDRDFRGMSSHYLHTLREGDRLNVFLDSADGFHLQDDVTKPMIFVSAGTGFAPMRAFLWERLALKRGRRAGGGGAVQRHPLQPASTTSTATRSGSSRPKECSTTFTSRRRASSPAAATTSRTGSASRARSSGACSPPAATSTSAARSRCATPSAPPSSMSSRNTGRCRASTPRPTSTSWRRPHATAQTSGADPKEPHGRPRPHPDRRGACSCSCSPPAAANCAASTRSRSGSSFSPRR